MFNIQRSMLLLGLMIAANQGTLHMVKDLKLPTMKPLDPETMKQIFKKQK